MFSDFVCHWSSFSNKQVINISCYRFNICSLPNFMHVLKFRVFVYHHLFVPPNIQPVLLSSPQKNKNCWITVESTVKSSRAFSWIGRAIKSYWIIMKLVVSSFLLWCMVLQLQVNNVITKLPAKPGPERCPLNNAVKRKCFILTWYQFSSF